MGTTKAKSSTAAAKRKKTSTPQTGAGNAETERIFTSITQHFLDLPGVTTARMFGSTCLKMSGKVFAVAYKGRLVLKLPPDQVAALVESSRAVLFDPGHGRVSKEWVSVAPEPRGSWLKLATNAREFVSTGKR